MVTAGRWLANKSMKAEIFSEKGQDESGFGVVRVQNKGYWEVKDT